MAGYNKQSKSYNAKISSQNKNSNTKHSSSSSSFSFSNLFRPRRSTARRADNARDDAPAPRKTWASDYDKGKYVAEPGIDRKATAFIERFHKSHFVEYERPAITAV